jgi:putative transposase
VLHSERFVDVSPEETWATLLDEGTYLCSTRTMYRILAAHHGGVRERRAQLTHPDYAKPELLAERPNELWSWDVSKLKGPAKWTYYYLYVILDVFSRFVPRHKTTVLFPDPLCGRRWRRPVMTGAHGSVVVLSGT